ncbi:MAG: primosomal protein N' [Nitrosomonadaceae bacterium]
MPIIRVALDVPVATLFDYLASDATTHDIGVRVQVPFGRKIMTGVIMEVLDSSPVTPGKLKTAASLFHDIPPLPLTLLDLCRFCSNYYHHPLGEVVMNSLPSRLRSNKPFIQKSTPPFQFRLTDAGRHADTTSIPVRSIIQHRLLNRLRENGVIKPDEARQISPSAPKVLQKFREMGWIEEVPIHSSSAKSVSSPVLNTEQQTAFDAIANDIRKFNVWLLHGITGSGKTEIYLRLITLLLLQGRQTLVLVPEISLTPQLEQIFRSRFPTTLLVCLHSRLSDSERLKGWLQAQKGEAKIVLGTRLAVFAPLPKLGMIIVDEEQDGSFKQQDGLRYSARDVSIFRAKQENVPVILGSATPSLESYYHATNGRYRMLRLSSRAVKKAVLPAVHCIDIRSAKCIDGLSQPLITALENGLAQDQQSLVFLNRRGYAPVLLCKSCSWTAKCHRCTSRLVVHLREKQLRCHHCGHQERFPSSCPDCGDQDIVPFGQGTQRVEALLAERFPNARILRIDRDSTRLKDGWEKMLKDIYERRVDILVGTQILAKGHDFPNLSLVGILNSDAALFSTDFRAAERLFAQLMQVAGRAGRADIPGEVLVQTEFPDHPLYHALRRHDYAALAQTLLSERKMAGFPPFVYQALLRAEAPQISAAMNFLTSAAELAGSTTGGVEIFDPVPAQMARLKGLERAHLLVQSGSRKKLQEFLTSWHTRITTLPIRKVRWSLDVDPQEF